MGATLRIDRCVCRQITFEALLPLARANGWDVPAIGRATGCGVQCGLCRPYLQEMLMTGTTVFHNILTDMPDEGTPA